MNRATRRRAAAGTRRAARPGYRHRLLGVSGLLAEKFRGRVVIANIEHDAWCDHYRGRECSCVPDISLVPDGSGDVLVVTADGAVTKFARQ
jgi:hypothetical protein